MTIGERIRDLRIDHDMSQSQVAHLLQTTQTYYAQYELGKRPIPNKHIVTLCLFYHVSADYILGLPKGLKWPR